MPEKASFPLAWDIKPGKERGAHDWVLSDFSLERSGSLVPLSIDEEWATIGMHAKRFGTTYLAGIFPPLPQFVARFQRALRSIPMPSITFPPEKTAVVRALLNELPIGGVVGMQTDMGGLVRSVREKKPPAYRYSQIIITPFDRPDATLFDPNAFFELHLVPGLVGLYQCEELAAEMRGAFHPSTQYDWEYESDRVLVTDPQGRFTKATLPARFKVRKRTCACGATVDITYHD